jgi:hypothetical protein
MDSVIMDGESTTSSPPMPSLPQPARKSRVALACTRCKKRKQRVRLLSVKKQQDLGDIDHIEANIILCTRQCDGGHPLCKSCEKAGTACIYEKTIRPHYPGGKSLYVESIIFAALLCMRKNSSRGLDTSML